MLLRVHHPALLEDLDVGPQARHGRAELVRGVGHELTLGVDGGVERPHGVLQGVHHGVEAERQAPDLVLADGGDPAREVLGALDVLDRLHQPPDGSYGRAAHEPPEERREGDPADADEQEDQAQAGQQVVDVGQLLGHLERVTASGRLGEDPHIDAVHAHVLEEGGSPPGRERACAGADREHQRAGSGRGVVDDLAAGVDQLLIALHLVRPGRGVAEGVVFSGARRPRACELSQERCAHAQQPAAFARRGTGQQQRKGPAQARRGRIDRTRWRAGAVREVVADALGALVQLGVDLVVEQVGDQHVGDGRGQHDRDRDGRGGDHCDAPPEAHARPASPGGPAPQTGGMPQGVAAHDSSWARST